MNSWVCECGKRVAASLKACPHCKTLRQAEIKVVSADTQYLKIIIGLLSVIIVVGGIFIFSRSGTSQNTSTYNPSKTNFDIIQIKKQVPQSAIEAVNALKKLKARTEIGVTYREYSPALADAKFVVDQYLDNQQSNGFPELTAEIRKAMNDFIMANKIWEVKFKSSPPDDILKKDHYIVAEIIKQNPELDKSAEVGGIFYGDVVAIDKLVPQHFRLANKHILNAATFIK